MQSQRDPLSVRFPAVEYRHKKQHIVQQLVVQDVHVSSRNQQTTVAANNPIFTFVLQERSELDMVH